MFQLSTMTFLVVALVLIQGSAALQVTSPMQNTVWNLEEKNTITWTTVSTDPSTFNLVLVNNNANCAPTGMSQIIKENVSAADEKYEVSGLQEVKQCSGYQINLVATSNGGILAQSSPFQVSGSGQSTNVGIDATTNGVTSAHNGTNGMTSGPNGLNSTQVGHVGGNHTPVANATSNPSLNSQSVMPQGKSTNVTASQSSALMVALSPPTLLTALALSALAFMI